MGPGDFNAGDAPLMAQVNGPDDAFGRDERRRMQAVVPGSRDRDWQGVHTGVGTLPLAQRRYRREGLRRPRT